jgi:poly(3-hydroxybutyrate) depolymerase
MLLTNLLIVLTALVAASASSLITLSNGRSYWIHLPLSYSNATSYPVVIAFHGSSKLGFDIDGFAMEADTRLSLPVIPTKYSETRIFVYPNGVSGTWAGPSYAKASITEDLQFISNLLDDLRKSYSTDDHRIYATGLSNGGGFVGILACSLVGIQFAAFAPVAGAFYQDAGGIQAGGCAAGRNVVPILEIHGGADRTVFYGGGKGEGGILPSIPSWLSAWQQRDNCTSSTTEDSDSGNVHHTSWTCFGISGVLQHWKVDKGDHYWPSKTENVGMLVAKAPLQPIEANDIVISFFDRFALA